MLLRKLSLLLFILSVCHGALEAQTCCDPCKGKFYVKLLSGASFAKKADIFAPPAVWDPAIQGYNSRWGTRPIIGGGIGYEACPFLSMDVTFAYRPQFSYSKFQTPVPNIVTPNFLGIKTRKMNLDVSSLMWTINLNGLGFDCLCWRPTCFQGVIYPIVGAGIGVSRLQIYNFRSVGIPGVDPTSPEKGFSSENEYTIRYRFAYQILAGLEYRYNDCWAISLGYRWFDTSKFKGPRYIRDELGNGADIGAGNEWRIKFKSNELFFEIKAYL